MENYAKNLLKRLERGEIREVESLKDYSLSLLQLYFSGLVDGRCKRSGAWPQEEIALDVLMKSSRKAVSNYYLDTSYSLEEILNPVIENKNRILKSVSNSYPKERHLSGMESQVERYARYVSNADFGEVDLIVPVASGGFEPALIVSECTGVDKILPVGYSRVSGEGDNVILTPANISESYGSAVSGKKILVVEDFLATGDTVKEVDSWCEQNGASEVRCSSVAGYSTALQNSRDLSSEKYSRGLFVIE